MGFKKEANFVAILLYYCGCLVRFGEYSFFHTVNNILEPFSVVRRATSSGVRFQKAAINSQVAANEQASSQVPVKQCTTTGGRGFWRLLVKILTKSSCASRSWTNKVWWMHLKDFLVFFMDQEKMKKKAIVTCSVRTVEKS
uniref:Uncharacterized protein n=1 Tax=Romanomermis culicivorax TaxID=13658 RepID=A0A915I1H6_ROMCU